MVEHACSITSLQLGETLGSVTKDMDTYTYREPLGVCAGITPFNFPAMIPLWVRETDRQTDMEREVVCEKASFLAYQCVCVILC